MELKVDVVLVWSQIITIILIYLTMPLKQEGISFLLIQTLARNVAVGVVPVILLDILFQGVYIFTGMKTMLFNKRVSV